MTNSPTFKPDGETQRRRSAVCSISPPARRRRRSWFCTVIRAIRSAICRRCTGSGCSPAMCISIFPRRAGPSMPGAVSSRPGMRRPRSSSPIRRRFNARGLLDTVARCGVTTFCAPPTVWRMLIQEDLAAWKVRAASELIGAGEPLNPEVIERVKSAWGITIRDGYGQTETTALVGNTPGQKVKAGSMGRPLPGYRVALLDPDGKAATRRRNLPDARAAADRPDAGLSGRRRRRAARIGACSIAPAMSPRSTTTAT